jgi:hypothetical protein
MASSNMDKKLVPPSTCCPASLMSIMCCGSMHECIVRWWTCELVLVCWCVGVQYVCWCWKCDILAYRISLQVLVYKPSLSALTYTPGFLPTVRFTPVYRS